MVKTTLTGDKDRYFLALIPATHQLDIGKHQQDVAAQIETGS